MSMRSGASVSQLRAEIRVPVGAGMVRSLSIRMGEVDTPAEHVAQCDPQLGGEYVVERSRPVGAGECARWLLQVAAHGQLHLHGVDAGGGVAVVPRDPAA